MLEFGEIEKMWKNVLNFFEIGPSEVQTHVWGKGDNEGIQLSNIYHYITDEDESVDFNTSENYFRAESSLFPPLVYSYAYCSSLSMAMTFADDGTIILTSDGEEIIQDCNGEWGGTSLEICGSCDHTLGDINNDDFLDVLDVVSIINYIIGNVEFDEGMLCAADLNQSEEINILDIVILVNQIIS